MNLNVPTLAFSCALACGILSANLRAAEIETFAPPTYRGKVILVVDKSSAIGGNAEVSAGLERLTADLIGDGWRVLRHDVERGPESRYGCTGNECAEWAPVTAYRIREVRALLRADYNAAPEEVKAVILFGHVPVPFSGTQAVGGGGHYRGANPADGFYGEMLAPYGPGGWTDTGTARPIDSAVDWLPECDNLPGDGKYDQDSPPKPFALSVGRLDLDMPHYADNETTPILRYLNKNHDFRVGTFTVRRKGIIAGMAGGGPFCMTSEAFNTVFESEDVLNLCDEDMHWFPNVSGNGQDYLIGYGGGWGSGQGAQGIGTTYPIGNGIHDFLSTSSRVPFVNLAGSWFGHWDGEDSFLKSPLANIYDPANNRFGYGLAVIWSGSGLDSESMRKRALGATLGDAVFRGTSIPANISVMGDPTLRLHIVRPASSPSAAADGPSIALNWTASTDTTLYNIYRAPAKNGPYTLVNSTGPVTGTSYTATRPVSGDPDNFYMIRAVRTESTPSGSYENMSEGVFASPASFTPYLQILAQPASFKTPLTSYGTVNSAGFTVDAVGCDSAGGGQITYQWYKNGNPIVPGADPRIKGSATRSLLITALQSTDAGSYQVAVGCGALSANSSAANLIISAPPQPADDLYDVTRTIAADFAVLANDTDPDAGDTLSIYSVSALQYPGISISADHQQIHLPAQAKVGTGTFKYAVTDGGSTAEATVTVRVNAIPGNTAPTVTPIGAQSLNPGMAIAIPFTISDDISAVDDLTIVATSSDGTVVPQNKISITRSGGDCVLHLEGGTAHAGAASITLNVTDEDGAVSSQTFEATLYGTAVTPLPFNPSFGTAGAFTFSVSGAAGIPLVIYKSSDLVNWQFVSELNPTAGDSTFTDSTVSGVTHRFYRVGNGTAFSQAIGFVRVTVPANGYALIANPLYGAQNTLNSLFSPAMPDGTTLPNGFQIKKWNGSAYVDYTWTAGSPGSWSPNGDLTLLPGEGVGAYNPTASAVTLTFAGLVPDGNLANPVAKGSQLCSSMLPRAGAVTTALGFPPEDGDQIQIYRNGMTVYSYDGDAQMWLPTEPVVEVGEAFWLRAVDGKNWMQEFSPAPVVKTHVAAAHFISSSEFGFTITAPSAGRYQVYKSGDLTSWTLMQEVTLTTAPTAFSDNTVSGQNRRFYRVGNGFAYSQPIGFVRVSVPANGYAAIADQLYAPRNTLNALFSPAMADGTTLPSGFQIKKWNGTAYVDYTWTAGSPGAWSPNGDATLLPGEGAMAYNPNGTAQTLTFAGLVADGHLPNAIRKGTHMGSSIVPRAGTITTALGFPPEDGDQIQLYHGGMSVYIFDGIDQLWSPTEPEIEVGEAFLVNPINGKNWIQGFSPTPIVAKAAVDGAHFISGNEFGFTIAAPVRGPYQVYQSSDLATWTFLQEVTLTSDSVAFSDNTVSGENHRYYRVGNGYTFSQAIGFVHTAVPANGYALVADQLYGTKNTLDALFNPAMPGGTTLPTGFQIKKWNGSALVDYTWTAGSPGSWSPNGEATLLPGEGVGAYNPTASAVNLTFAGLVADGNLPNSIVKGFQLCSSMLPRAGAITSALGYPPEDGDQIQVYRNGMTVYSYDGDAQMWLPTEPVIEVGESFWVRPIEGKNWIQEFSPAPVEKARVDSAQFISGSEFGFTITAPGAGRYQVYKSGDLTSWTLMQDVTLTATPTAFSDNTISGQNRRFYRVGNGIAYSQPIGFVRISVPANGYALVADQLYAPRNTLDALFSPAMADGTSLPTGFQINKWNGSSYVEYTWTAGSPGSWSPNGDTTLAPGEGAMAYNPTGAACTLSFAGLVADGNLPNSIVKGSLIRSSMQPRSGAVTTALGFPPEDGDQIQLYHGGFTVYSFDGVDQIWFPADPVVEVGEAFWLRAINSKNWINSYPVSQ